MNEFFSVEMKTIKNGNSFAVQIPTLILKKLCIKQGEKVSGVYSEDEKTKIFKIIKEKK